MSYPTLTYPTLAYPTSSSARAAAAQDHVVRPPNAFNSPWMIGVRDGWNRGGREGGRGGEGER